MKRQMKRTKASFESCSPDTVAFADQGVQSHARVERACELEFGDGSASELTLTCVPSNARSRLASVTRWSFAAKTHVRKIGGFAQVASSKWDAKTGASSGECRHCARQLLHVVEVRSDAVASSLLANLLAERAYSNLANGCSLASSSPLQWPLLCLPHLYKRFSSQSKTSVRRMCVPLRGSESERFQKFINM